jgi:predicted TIM-barrel fold metal-dependent hydrolase
VAVSQVEICADGGSDFQIAEASLHKGVAENWRGAEAAWRRQPAGVRAVRPFENVYIEFSGSDPHSGRVDFTVGEIGVNRLVWGGHGPSRSYSTELAKVLDADLTLDERLAIFGGNLRRIVAPIFRQKGYRL